MAELSDFDPRLADFIKRTLVRGPILKIDVKHRTASGTSLVDSVPINPGDSLDSVSQAAWALAQGDADGHARPQKYWFVPCGQSGPMARIGFTFTATGEETETGDIGDTEEATPSGIMSMLMKHVEEGQRIMVEGLATALRTVRLDSEQKAKDLKQKEEENASLRRERVETFEAYRTLVVALDDKSFEREKERRKAQMEERVLSKVELLFPVAMNKFLGKGGTDLPGEILENVALLRRSIEMNPARIPLIVAPLLPEQMIALQSLMSADGKGPMTGELIRQFFKHLTMQQVETWASSGAFTAEEIKLVAKINNLVADLAKTQSENVEKRLPPIIPSSSGVSANVQAAISASDASASSSEGK
jgi:hypothetical protein